MHPRSDELQLPKLSTVGASLPSKRTQSYLQGTKLHIVVRVTLSEQKIWWCQTYDT